MKLPLILLIFANDQANYLQQVSKEMEHLRGFLTAALHKRGFELEYFPYTNSEELLEYLNDNRQRLVLLHFAGHSNSDVLKLDEGELHIQGLAEKLSSCPNLQLVVLNGCQNAPQVQTLRNAGIPAAIGTNAPLGDQTAREFTKAFYTALIKNGLSVTTAFNQAKQDIETRTGKNFRSLDINTTETTQQAWVWFLDPPDVSWKLLEATEPCNRLPLLDNLKLPTDDNPFRSLRYYRERHARLFFGRCQELLETINLLDNMTSDILLIHSATGIGKTSFLLAGLVPRLKVRHQKVEYCRYNELDHRRDIREQIFGSADPTSVSIRLHQPSPQGLPAIWIIDQVEDAFLAEEKQDSSSPFPTSLTKLLKILHTIFNPPSGIKPPHVKIVMALRKEWFAELLDACQKYAVNQINYPLKSLDKNAIIKILCELVENPELQQAYRLRIEPSCEELANQIADDLLIDSQSGIAPTLQIILYQLWEKIKNDDDRVWTRELYETENHRGLLLETYIDRQLSEISKQKTWGKEARDSGLMLDVLFAHATQRGTSQNLDAADYEKRYSHIHYRRDLLDTLKKHYLLIDTYINKATAPSTQTRLVHDTLAQVIEDKYDSSTYPGQKARRILDGRKAEWKNAGNKYTGHALERYDLQQVEKGQNGTSNWREDPCEFSIMKKSIKHRKLDNTRKGAAILILVITFASSIWFGFQAREQTKAAIINSLLTHAHALSHNYQNNSSQNTDQALLLALHAEQLETNADKRSEIYHTISQILYSSSLYRKPSLKNAYGAKAGDELWTFHKDGRIIIKNKKDKRSFVLQRPTLSLLYFPDSDRFDEKSGRLVTLNKEKRNLQIWDTESRKLQGTISLDEEMSPINYFDIGTSGIIITQSNREQIFWNDFGRKIKTTNLNEASTNKPIQTIPIDYTEDINTITQKPTESILDENNQEKIGFNKDIQKIIISPMKSFIILDKAKNTIQYFDFQGRKLSDQYKTSAKGVAIIKPAPNGNLVIIDNDNNIQFCQNLSPPSQPKSTGQQVKDIKFNEALNQTITIDNNNLMFWDERGEPVYQLLKTSKDSVIAFSPSGSLAIANNSDGTLKIIDPRNNLLIKTLEVGNHIGYLKFLSEKALMAWDQNDTTIKLWDIVTTQSMQQPIPHPNPSEIIQNSRKSMILSHDRKADATLWNINLKQIIGHLSLPGSIIAFSPDGEYLAIEENGNIRIHNFDEFTPDGFHEQACNIANHNLSKQDWNTFIGKFLPYDWLIFKPTYHKVCNDFPEPPDIHEEIPGIWDW
ncbi:MAG: CHAT domain-containing protein [Gammaproteobacteria bacterium]|nr:CHAT domain-containing protein [Gammaproteobacteria bacterium]MBU1722919.1 CHAT domain-containing protein [Gammaproteobacteria bacterium]MBU2005704.1 CHAT domain-containing protein [Gammaproteobacteria bacterium]